jgi:hypothetical protein
MGKEVLEALPTMEEGKVVLVRSRNTGIVNKYKCKCNHLIEANICDKNQHGCIEKQRLASIRCKRKELSWNQVYD